MGKRYSVAVDFDGVIHSYTSPWIDAETIPDPPVDGAIDWLNAIQKDFDVVIFTTRGATLEGANAVLHYLSDHGFIARAGSWPEVTATKPPCLIYLDDRAYRFEGPGTFPSADEIHRARPWNKRGTTTAAKPRSPDSDSDSSAAGGTPPPGEQEAGDGASAVVVEEGRNV